MGKKCLALALVLGLALGLAAPASAYSAPDFSDVPQHHWAYAPVMRMAEMGVIQGTGDGMFRPEEPLTAEMFLTLVGRILFPEVEARADDWSGPYIAALEARGILEGTKLTDETRKGEISRYDMAAVLAGCVALLDEEARPVWAYYPFWNLADFDEIPYEYVGAVSIALGAGLIQGDQDHFFHGEAAMTRQEAAVVADRLLFLKRRLSGELPTALTAGEHALSVADMDYYYHQALYDHAYQEQYMEQLYAYHGLEYPSTFDATGDMRTQYVDGEPSQSYRDYFLEQAKTTAAQVMAFSDAARAEGYTMRETARDALEDTAAQLDEQVRLYNFNSRDDYLKYLYGPSMTEAVYRKNLELQALAADYSDAKANAVGSRSQEELEGYYARHADKLDSYAFDAAYLDAADGSAAELTDGEKAAAMAGARRKAEDLARAVKDGQSAALTDAASAQGVFVSSYTWLKGSSFSANAYADWLMDEARRDGDVEIFQEDTGWRVIQFHDRYLDNSPTVDVRHILLSTETDDGAEPDDGYIAQVKARAQAILEEFQAGEQTAEAFGALAERYSQDGRDADGELYYAGGLYTGIYKGQMIQPFEDWCFDPARTEGDTGLVKTQYGWHIMYFQGRHRPGWMDLAEKAINQEELEQIEAGYGAVEGPGWGWVGLPLGEFAE